MNNIVDGSGKGTFKRSHNIGSSLLWYQKAQQGWLLQEGEILEPDLGAIFVDPENGDFHLLEGSAAIDGGTDITPNFPIDLFPDYDFTRGLEGKSRPQGVSWDVGPYEVPFSEPAPTPTATPPGRASGQPLGIQNWGLYD